MKDKQEEDKKKRKKELLITFFFTCVNCGDAIAVCPIKIRHLYLKFEQNLIWIDRIDLMK